MRILSMLPATTLAPAVLQVRVPVPRSGTGTEVAEGEGEVPAPREVSAVETVNLMYVWRLARRLLGLEDLDPLAPPPPPVAQGGDLGLG